MLGPKCSITVVEKKVVVFIDNVMVAMETEEGHNKIVKKY